MCLSFLGGLFGCHLQSCVPIACEWTYQCEEWTTMGGATGIPQNSKKMSELGGKCGRVY